MPTKRRRKPGEMTANEHIAMATSFLQLAERHINSAGEVAGTSEADMLACFASNVLQGSLSLLRELRASLKGGG